MTLPMLRRLLPVVTLLLGLVLFLLFGLERYFSFEMLSRHHAELAAWVTAHVALAALIYVLFYALAVAFSLPIAVVITPVGGFLFGVWLGALLSVIGATLGSVALFLAARTAFRDLLRARAGATLARLEDGFRRDSFNYLLFLRLVPVFPFWLVNIVPALLGMQLGPYTLATLIGIVPGAVIYAGVGASFGTLIERGERPDFGVIFEWHILLPLLGLAALSLLPVVYTRLRGGKAAP
ncbi:MAG: TVP38/TMEM64 family protein [Reyranella sp.]|uniref:TVP38/TMEM64 family protein n=1 Tax=Reyranella sp. TaxID=1929291 RepID=UPI002730E013|nr:TVP38/TMEM64 family protein [Reyranella sp.]MDP1963313.1 TVP38/TMEM64 family protein [Reyranella sp.]MDP2373318.1 TVP38/TMEM64 family protein [Reyranella sp.]